MSEPISIGEINPDGRNNAIYCFVYVNGVRQKFQVAIWEFFDQPQSKNKYGLAFVIGNPSNLPAGARVYPESSENAYWQVQNVKGFDICTVGEQVQTASSTVAIAIKQTVDPTKPAQ